jgi:CheY-like chemotaxis protein
MYKSGPIISIEDDLDDQDLFKEVLTELGVKNEVVFFKNGMDALSYIRSTPEQPFIIFCDINMPCLNGLEVRNQINEDEELRLKAIPFVFFTTASSRELVNEAYRSCVQGFFTKPSSLDEIKAVIKQILDYWANCNHPLQYR